MASAVRAFGHSAVINKGVAAKAVRHVFGWIIRELGAPVIHEKQDDEGDQYICKN